MLNLIREDVKNKVDLFFIVDKKSRLLNLNMLDNLRNSFTDTLLKEDWYIALSSEESSKLLTNNISSFLKSVNKKLNNVNAFEFTLNTGLVLGFTR